MKHIDKLISFRRCVLCNLLSLLMLINALKLFWIGVYPNNGWGIALFVVSIIGGAGSLFAGVGSLGYGMDALEKDKKYQVRTSPILGWIACHIYQDHKFEKMREATDEFGNDYTDEVCIFCKKTYLDATKYLRKEKKNVNIDFLTQKAKAAYCGHLTKEERKELFIERI